VVEAVISAGATTVNIPDTVGYATPTQMHRVIKSLVDRVPNIDKAVISTHCHDDLGLAVANSLAAVEAGAGQIECTINGLGERAGNCSLEEVVMALRTRGDYYQCSTRIATQKLVPTSRLVANITGIQVPRNKAIVGKNAFAHEAGIHQDGMLKEPRTYEIMRPEDVGLERTDLVLGKHSGRAALVDRAKALEVMETLLQKHGAAINAVFCGNDAMAMGAYQALAAAGRDDVKLFGFDGADEVVKLVAARKISATGMQFPKTMARQAAEYADEWIKGKRDFPQKVPVAVEVVTPETVNQYGDYGAKEEERAPTAQ
jgi:isopropylmalate/homocitrate/citramalate synthase